MAGDPSIPSLMLDELFSSQSEQFLSTLHRVTDGRMLAAFAEMWKKDPRPWARAQIFAYLDETAERLLSKPLLKRFFKHAEERADDELMAAFLVTFDTFVRRVRQVRVRYDWQSQSSWREESLKSPRDRRPFSYHTRYYLRRRAWRYFRRLGFQQPAKYCAAISMALRRYADEDFAKGENILDSWGLVHALFHGDEALEFTVSKVNVKPGRDLAELMPAPYFLKLWQETAAIGVLLDLVLMAASRLVRTWAMGMLRRHHGRQLRDITIDRLLKFLEHDDEEVQQFAAELLEHLGGLDRLPIETWFQLLSTRNLTALETIAQLMLREVNSARVTLQQCVDLAIAKQAPVARLGWELLRTREVSGLADLPEIARLADAKASAVAMELTRWALGIVGTAERYDIERVIPFFDSLLAGVRGAAWAWLIEGCAGYNDAALWSRLLESPYDDAKFHLIAALEMRAKLPGAGADPPAALWCGVLLNIHRGGRQKLTALRQISRALVEHPERAESLLPVMAVALRSVRPPEARAGLTAIVGALDASPQIAPLVARYLPDLRIEEVIA